MEDITPSAIRRLIQDGHATLVKGRRYELKYKYAGMSTDWLTTPALVREVHSNVESLQDNAVNDEKIVTLKAAWLTKRNAMRVMPADVDKLKYYALNERTAWNVNSRLYGAGMIDIAPTWDERDQRYGWSIRLSAKGVAALESAGKTVAQLKQDVIDAANAEKARLDHNTIWPTRNGDVITLTCAHFPDMSIQCDYSTGRVSMVGDFSLTSLYDVKRFLDAAYYMLPSKGNQDREILPRLYNDSTNVRR